MRILHPDETSAFHFSVLSLESTGLSWQNIATTPRLPQQFSRLVRLILEIPAKPLPPPKRTESMQLYLSLESLRFRNRFTYQISLQPGLPVSSSQTASPIISSHLLKTRIWRPDAQDITRTVDHRNLHDAALWIRITDDGVRGAKACRAGCQSQQQANQWACRLQPTGSQGSGHRTTEKACCHLPI